MMLPAFWHKKEKLPLTSVKGSFVLESLQLYNVFSLRAAVALDNVELYALAFVEGFEAFAGDRGEVNEHVRTAFYFDEAKTFFSVEPFNGTSLH